MENRAEEAYSVGMGSKIFDMFAGQPLRLPYQDATGGLLFKQYEQRGKLFAQQEVLLILLNLFALISLVLIQWLFRGLTDPFSFDLAMLLFALRIVEQAGEGLWLHRHGGRLSARAQFWYGRASILINLVFAGTASLAANSVDAHYSVLLVLPVIAAAFRLSRLGVALVIFAAGCLAFAETWVFFLRNPPADLEEFFEAATVSLIYVVIGSVVWGLARQIKRNATRLEQAVVELEATRDRLVEEEKLSAIGKLASSVAHEVRNPVAMITSALSTAQKEGTTPALREELYSIAAKEAGRLEKVTDDFLSYARPRIPEKRRVSARETLEYVAGLLRARSAEEDLRLTISCSSLLDANIDQFQIHQALINLGLNALEHKHTGGAVVLGGQKAGGLVELFVGSEGELIPAEKEKEIFDPFFTTRPNGTGLGLSISRNICRAHGGDLRLTRNSGGWVQFTLMLPEN